MNKDNAFRSSEFHMDVNDVWHIIYKDESGDGAILYLQGEASDTTPEAISDPSAIDYDGNYYTSIVIGSQEWMVENLKTTHYRDGTPIPNLTLNGDWASEDGTPGHDGAYCWYNNDITNSGDYGALYNWYAVTNARELAPTGWRIPGDLDFNTLITTIGGFANAGAYLKEIGFVHWNVPNEGAIDSYGFRVRGAGLRSSIGAFAYLKYESQFWTTDVGFWYYSFYNSYIYGGRSVDPPQRGFSVRCMRDI